MQAENGREGGEGGITCMMKIGTVMGKYDCVYCCNIIHVSSVVGYVTIGKLDT